MIPRTVGPPAKIPQGFRLEAFRLRPLASPTSFNWTLGHADGGESLFGRQLQPSQR